MGKLWSWNAPVQLLWKTNLYSYFCKPSFNLTSNIDQARFCMTCGIWNIGCWREQKSVKCIELFSAYIKQQQSLYIRWTVVVEGYNEFGDTIRTCVFFFEVTGQQTRILILGDLWRIVWANGVSLHLHSRSWVWIWVLQLKFKPVPLSSAY